jgi:hypothetical protein
MLVLRIQNGAQFKYLHFGRKMSIKFPRIAMGKQMGTRHWSFGSVGAPFLFLGKLNK